MAIIFTIRAIEEFEKPGIGLGEVYVLGGFILTGLIFRQSLQMRKTKMQHMT